jgi:peptide/nickel transport system substrate-binding protein
MARRIRWQIIIAAVSSFLVIVLLSGLALSTTISHPRVGGTYVEAITGAPQDVIPLLNSPLADPVGQDLEALLFDGLTRIGEGGVPAPSLAESWRIEQEGKVYIFHLRRDVVWHDGESFTAEDVLFTIHTIQSSQFVGDPSLAGIWRNVLIDRIDDYTVRFTLNAPYAPFVSATCLPMLPAHLLAGVPMEQWATSSFARQPVGTGPYQVVDIGQQGALLRANPSYFDGSPFIEHMEFRFIESPSAALSTLARHEVQTFGVAASRETNQVALPREYHRAHFALDEYVMVSFNMRQPPLNDLAFRQALARGLNKDRLIARALPEVAMRLDTPILPGWWAYDAGAKWYPYSSEEAAQALEQLGYGQAAAGQERTRNGEPLVLPLITTTDPNWLAAAQEVARQWGEIGVRVEIEQLESTELRQRLHEHNFVLALHGWARLGADPDILELWHSSQADEGLNYAGLRDPRIDQVLSQGRVEHDLMTRRENYVVFQRRWIELVPGITLYQPLYTFIVSDEVGGGRFEEASNVLLVGREDRYRNVSNWFVRRSQEIRGYIR